MAVRTTMSRWMPLSSRLPARAAPSTSASPPARPHSSFFSHPPPSRTAFPTPFRALASDTAPPTSSSSSAQYPFSTIEPKWQRYWLEHETFKTPAFADLDTSKPKFYALDMFPYPSGAGLHVGHPEGYTATDIMARYKRMCGYNVLHPMGWDAFGLPAEQYALQTGTHPAVTTKKNINRFREQLQSLGFSYDWSREVATTEPRYYKWTQWIFLQLLQNDLAFTAEVPVNWCPALGTVLANEEVIDGLSERGSHPVFRMPMKQWMLKITQYADRLLTDLDPLDWADSIKDMQRNWIGRSEGAEISFALPSLSSSSGKGAADADQDQTPQLTVFTTRPDTLFGATYMVIAPEHPLVDALTVASQREAMTQYVEAAARKSDLERTELSKGAKKTGVDTGSCATHPATGEPVPIWVADYVLGSYGTGAIMAVPAHDERDFAFAQEFHLPIKPVVRPSPRDVEGEGAGAGAVAGDDDDKETTTTTTRLCYAGTGYAVSSANADGSLVLDGQTTAEAKKTVTAWLVAQGRGAAKVNYKLRDWLFARQRYWGEPFPVVYAESAPDLPVALPESALPVVLPETEDFAPSGDGRSPLANVTDWVRTTDPSSGEPAERETNTMPQWAGSCWYYLRYISPEYDEALVDPAAEKYWMPVDLYVGGAEHAVLHLLYARFWHKFLYDQGHVSTAEPFQKLVSQGMILGEVEYTGYHVLGREHEWVSADDERVVRALAKAATSSPSNTAAALEEEGICAVSVPAEEVVTRGGQTERTASSSGSGSGSSSPKKEGAGIRVTGRAHKMSKSRGNVINPDDIVSQYGADSLRLYEMFMGPLRDTKVWSTRSVEGVYRFLGRVWRLFPEEAGAEAGAGAEVGGSTGSSHGSPTVSEGEPTVEQLRALHACIKKVTEEVEEMRFNTALAAMMEYVNAATKWDHRPRGVLEPLVRLLAPFAPHIAEELWATRLGHKESITYAEWPTYDPALLVEDEVKLPVQVGGKMRGTVVVSVDVTQEEAVRAATTGEGPAAKWVEGKEIKKIIFVPGKILNIIVGK